MDVSGDKCGSQLQVAFGPPPRQPPRSVLVAAGAASPEEDLLALSGHTFPVPGCSMTSSDPSMLVAAQIALALTCIVMVSFTALVTYWSASAQRDEGRQCQERSLAAFKSRRGAMRWANVSVLFCNLNYVIVFPSGTQGMTEVFGSLSVSGVWIGLYAAGALAILPVFLLASVQETKHVLLFHGICVLVGNGLMLGAMSSGSLWPIFLGRAICGMEAGVKYFADNLNFYLTTPGKERLRAMFGTKMATAAGNAVGLFVGPFLQWLVLSVLPHGYINVVVPISSFRGEALCSAFMLAYAVVFLSTVLLFFESPEQYQNDQQVSEIAANQSQETDQQAVRRTTALFAATVFTTFTRIFITYSLKSGSLIVFTHSYCIATIAPIVVCCVELGLLLCRNLLDALAKWTKDVATLQRILEMVGLLAIVLMFRITSVSPASLPVFLVSSSIFCFENAGQAGVMLTISADSAIADHPYLNKKMLNVYSFIAQITCWLLAPTVTSALMQVVLHQNALAALLLARTAVQVAITFAHIRPKGT